MSTNRPMNLPIKVCVQGVVGILLISSLLAWVGNSTECSMKMVCQEHNRPIVDGCLACLMLNEKSSMQMKIWD